MKDFLIGLDLDGVMYQWDSTARFMLRQRITAKGANPPTELFFPSLNYNSIQDMVSPADWDWLWSGAIEDGLYRYGHVEQGAMAGAKALSNLGDLVVITSRPKAAVNDTIHWLSTMFVQIPLAGIVIQSNGQRKSEVHPTPNVYVEDMPHVADDILDHTGSTVVMPVQPWNEKYGADWGDAFLRRLRLYQVKGWPEIVRHVQGIREADL